MLNLDVSQGQTAGQYPRRQKFQNYLSEVRAKNPLALDSDDMRKVLFENRYFYSIVYSSSIIEAPLHTLQDACIVDFIEQNKFDDFKFDCHYIKL